MNPVQQLLTDNIGLWTGADTARNSGRGRTSSSAGTVYGIRKLRELILELAVRGKLVPQDSSDEPASALLARIQAEKARLVVEGKIKKDKPLAAISSGSEKSVCPVTRSVCTVIDAPPSAATAADGCSMTRSGFGFTGACG